MWRTRGWLVLLTLGLAPVLARAEPQTVLLLGSPSARVERILRGELARLGLEPKAPPPLGAELVEGPAASAPILQAEQALVQARKHYYQVQTARALELLDQQLRVNGGALAAARLDLLGALHLWRGICLLKQAERAAAQAAFASAILLGQSPPDESRFGPSVHRAFSEAASVLAARPLAELLLSVRPEGARVSVDGRPLERARSRLAPGEHWVVVEAPGFVTSSRAVQLEAGRTSQLQISLYPAERRVLQRQLQALAKRGELDPSRRLLALGLCRYGEAQEALVAVESRTGSRIELTLRRIECNQGRLLGQQREAVRDAGLEGAIERAVAALFGHGAPSRPARGAAPFYRRWWFWTLVGVAVVGGATAGIVAGTRGPGTYTLRVE